MALLAGKWKVSKARPSANNDRRTTATSIYKSYNFLKQGCLQPVPQSTEPCTAALCLSGAYVTWPEQHSCGRLYQAWITPDSCLFTEYSFSLFPFFSLNSTTASLSQTILHDNTQRKAIRKHISSIRDSAISLSFIGHPSCLHFKETYALFRTLEIIYGLRESMGHTN